MLNVPQSQIARLTAAGVPDLSAAVADFQQALKDHAKTIGVPAPVAPDPLVADIVRRFDGAFTIVEDETGLPPDDPESLTSRLAKMEAAFAVLQKQVAETEASATTK